MEKTYRELCAEIETLKQAAEVVRKRESAAALAEVRRLIVEFSFSAEECGFVEAGSQAALKPRSAVKVKYRHPDNALLTWTGRGKTPKWLIELEAQGHYRDAYLVGA